MRLFLDELEDRKCPDPQKLPFLFSPFDVACGELEGGGEEEAAAAGTMSIGNAGADGGVPAAAAPLRRLLDGDGEDARGEDGFLELIL